MMASASEPAGSKTPPPTTSLRTPPAPRLGYHDSWEPYSPRKSARISSQRAANRTPSPRASTRQPLNYSRTAKKALVHGNNSIASPMTSPRKRSQPAVESRRQVSGFLTTEGTADAAAALGLNSEKHMQRTANTSISQAAGMLPTPSKTPRKPPSEKTATTIQSFARNLFSSEQEPMPSPQKKRSKKYSGVTLESFTAEEEEEPIAIFTDSQDRVPEKDDSEANPFYGSSTIEPSRKQSIKKLVNIPGEGLQSVDEASRRDDGMVYVFRGKKFFRKFSEQDQSEDQSDSPGEGERSRTSRPLTRAFVKPRLLFPVQKMIEDEDEEDEEDEEGEEALTDIEDMHLGEAAPQTPRKPQSISAETPEAPRYAPVSPPDTRRTTRSTNKLCDTPMKITGRKSPFDSWPRTKEHKSQSPVAKRPGENLASATTKRTRA
ncbi:hypothetical protein EsDP_00004832 [Epichloe bromicola]|uniref:Uncharacterized protein n=1 Tax=Epichloe bromicola TaxID=79588 RepID=A0ABQ0CSW2_9HYPO